MIVQLREQALNPNAVSGVMANRGAPHRIFDVVVDGKWHGTLAVNDDRILHHIALGIRKQNQSDLHHANQPTEESNNG